MIYYIKPAQTYIVVLMYIFALTSLLTVFAVTANKYIAITQNVSNSAQIESINQSIITTIVNNNEDLFNPINSITIGNTEFKADSNNNIASDGIEHLGKITAKSDDAITVCSKVESKQIERIYLEQHQNIHFEINTSSSIDIGIKNFDFIHIILTYSSNSVVDKVELGLSNKVTNNSNSDIMVGKDNLTYPTLQNYMNLSSIIYKYSNSNNNIDDDLYPLTVNIGNAEREIANLTGKSGVKIQAIDITPIGIASLKTEFMSSSDFNSTYIKLTCRSTLGDQETVLSSANKSIYYPISFNTAEMFDYVFAVGKYTDDKGQSNFVLTK